MQLVNSEQILILIEFKQKKDYNCSVGESKFSWACVDFLKYLPLFTIVNTHGQSSESKIIGIWILTQVTYFDDKGTF